MLQSTVDWGDFVNWRNDPGRPLMFGGPIVNIKYRRTVRWVFGGSLLIIDSH